MDTTPLSLQRQCLVYLICHLEKVPASSLALLPARIRYELLQNLTVADICKLEGTTFVEGLNTENIWNTIAFKFPIPQDFPEQHFRSIYDYESAKDYFFTYIYHMVLVGMVPAVQNIATRLRTQAVHAMVSGSSPEGFQSFAKMLISLQSCAATERPNSIIHHVFKESGTATLKEPFVPERYTHFLQDFESGKLPHPMATVVLEACNYHPKAARINCSKLADTQLYKDNPTTNLLNEIFKEVRYLHVTFFEVFHQARLEACWGVMGTILPVALKTLKHLRLQYQTTFAMEITVNSTLPKIYSAVTQSRSTLQQLAVTINKRRPAESDQIPAKVEQMIQSLSHLFKTETFSCLILEGISFQLPDIVPDILSTFLSQPCTGKQRLVFSRIHTYRTPQIYPEFTPINCAIRHKEMKFHSMTPPVDLFKWLLGGIGHGLRVLEFPLEGWYPCNRTEDIYDSRDFRAKKTALEVCAENTELRVECLSFHLHLLSDHKMGDYFRALFQNPSIKILEFPCCNIGPGDLLSDFTKALIAQAKVGSLRELNVSENELGKQPDLQLEDFFNALFSLPQLSELSINLSQNQLNSQHFEIMFCSWKQNASRLKVNHVCYDGNRYVNESQMQDMAETFSVSSCVFAK